MDDQTIKNEARKWISENNNSSPLATNKFDTKEKALEFVEKLYELGAELVLVDNIRDEDWRIQKEGGPYADSLKVTLPQDLEKRKKLFAFNNENVDEEEHQAEDEGQVELLMWWD